MTLSELRDRVLRTLGVLAFGETADSDHADLVEELITEAQEELETLDIALWTIADVPDYAVPAFIRYVLPEAGAAFGKPSAGGTVLDEAYKERALRKLRQLTNDRRAGSVGTADYF